MDLKIKNRYLDMIMNEQVRQKFLTRTKAIKYLRNFLDVIF
jgi:lysyl-tRNA synthetase class 2